MTTTEYQIKVKELSGIPTRKIKSLPIDMYFKRMTRYDATLNYGEGSLLLNHLSTMKNAFLFKSVRSESIDKALVSFVITEESSHE